MDKRMLRGLKEQAKFEMEYGKIMFDKFNEVFKTFMLLPQKLREDLVGTLLTYMLLEIKDEKEREECLKAFMDKMSVGVESVAKQHAQDNLDEIFGKGEKG